MLLKCVQSRASDVGMEKWLCFCGLYKPTESATQDRGVWKAYFVKRVFALLQLSSCKLGLHFGIKKKRVNKKKSTTKASLSPYRSGGEPRGLALFYLVVAHSLLCASFLCSENVYPYRPRGQQGRAPCPRLPSGSRAVGQTGGEHAFVWSSLSILPHPSLPCWAFL